MNKEIEGKSLQHIDVYIQKGTNGKTPLYATAGSAGCDVFAARNIVLLPGETAVVPLNISIALPEGFEFVFPYGKYILTGKGSGIH